MGGAAFYAVWLINVTPCISNDGLSPHYKIRAQESQLSLVRTFGCTGFVHIHLAARTDKLDPRARKYIFIGISTTRHGWRMLDPFTRHVVESRDVVFW